MKTGALPPEKKKRQTLESTYGENGPGFEDLNADCIYEILELLNLPSLVKFRGVSSRLKLFSDALIPSLNISKISKGSQYLKELESQFLLTKPKFLAGPAGWNAIKKLKMFNTLAAWLEWEVNQFQKLFSQNQLLNVPLRLKDSITTLKLPIRDGDVNELKRVDSLLDELNSYFIEQKIDKKSKLLSVHDSITRLPTVLLEKSEYQEFWSKLEDFYIDHNKLLTLPSAIQRCANLKTLVCHSNSLYFLPSELGECKKLEHLSLCWNKLQKLPDSITSLPNLKYLFCLKNKLIAIPQNIGNLKRLCISYNDIRMLPDELADCSKLEWLECKQNYLISLPKQSIRRIDDDTLAFQKCGLESICMASYMILSQVFGGEPEHSFPTLFQPPLENSKQPWKP